jgi:hypothetical protein
MAKVNTTLICHFWNNAWILPYWLRHHTRLFDHGIMIDHGASDGSVDIIRKLAPTWEVRKTQKCIDNFVAKDADQEVMAAEREVKGWKMVLNVTEFLLVKNLHNYINVLPGDVRGVTTSGVVLVDMPWALDDPVSDEPLFLSKTYGYFEYELGKKPEDYGIPGVWRSRLLHNYADGQYEIGRHVTHVEHIHDPRLFLAWTGWAPYHHIKAMKMAVQTRIPSHEFEQGFSVQHQLATENDLLEKLRVEQERSHDLLADKNYLAALRALGLKPRFGRSLDRAMLVMRRLASRKENRKNEVGTA